MTHNDFDAIPAVENLQNVASLTPTGQRQERKRRQNPPQRDQGRGETPPDKAAAECDSDSHRIDYCA
jgi:hypothetical protein